MSRHEGVSCDNCSISNFVENRFKCLICYDYDLCVKCHDMSISTSRHLASHPMQCIITRNEYSLYFAGENYTPETPPSFVCPFCGKLGFTESLLLEHVNKEHADVHTQVVCPICAALPSGDPNLVTHDLSAHLSMEHRAPRDAEDSLVGGGRHIRRMFYPGRGMRSRNHRNMQFTGGPISATSSATSSASSAILGNNSALSSSAVASTAGRDSMDPIAELLTQLSGVRKSAQQLQQSVTTATQLHDLQTQLQLERHRATEIRQQLECFPSKLTALSGTSQNIQPAASVSAAGKPVNKKSPTATPSDDDEDPRFLLSCLDDETLSPQEQEKQSNEDFNRNLFVQELFLSMLSDSSHDASDRKDDVIATSSREHATPVECPVMASTPTAQLTFRVSENSLENLESEAASKSMQDASSESNDDTGVGISMCADTSTETSPVLYSLSTVSEQERARSTSGSSTAVSSRSAPVLASGDRRLIPELPPQWHFHGDDNEKDSDDDKPPSPTPTMHRGLLLQGGRSMLLGGSHGVHLGGGASSISDYNRDEVPTGGTLSKHPR